MYKHNEGERRKDGTFHWNDQPFLTFAGFHDDESHYQKTFLHVYDWFLAPYARVKRFNDRNTINRTTYGGQPIMTTYFKSQKPIISGVQAVLTSPDQKAGRLVYNFTLSGSGTYRLIALVSFPFYGNDRIEVKINGQSVTIGGNNLEEWYPFYVDGHHYYDVGSFSFGTSNTIEVGLTNGAIIYGFIVCQSFDQNFIGGSALYDTNIQPFYKRGEVVDGKTTKVKADVPSNGWPVHHVCKRIGILCLDHIRHP
ncbi:hypothetical protein HUR95_04905 [Caldalkalibacillus thermarum TA2.A1]|uniref:Uncharacterized protein n=1 Tax=Caldalkalibacillus thermarum (strain TA2.A1) TaxID=986075 RepID=A0A8X8I5P3_CALTT|nr:hypothetical protein [Caldalkalibacillus thermarum]QZT34680.1 hypothetical protein HUR95_04905 [Caldalkalibacillus thermarum TA2.A1]